MHSFLAVRVRQTIESRLRIVNEKTVVAAEETKPVSDMRQIGPAVDLGKLPFYLGYQTRQAQTAVFRNFAQIMSGVGLTPGEFSLLTLVRNNPGIHQVSLVQVYQLDKSTLSNTVKDMRKRQLLRLIRDDKDRRYYGLWLTECGAEALARATVRVEQQEDVMDTVLGPGEREQLLDLLARIASAFD